MCTHAKNPGNGKEVQRSNSQERHVFLLYLVMRAKQCWISHQLDFTPFEFKCSPSRFFCHLFSTRHSSLGPGCIFYLASLFLIVYQLQRAILIRGLLELWMLSDSELLKIFRNDHFLFNTHSAKTTNGTYKPRPGKRMLRGFMGCTPLLRAYQDCWCKLHPCQVLCCATWKRFPELYQLVN